MDRTSTKPSTPVTAPPKKPVPTSSPTFAPPPGAASHWDGNMKVYVLEDQPDTFYRQRTYYRWSNGWSRSISPNGPWEETNVQGVPPWRTTCRCMRSISQFCGFRDDSNCLTPKDEGDHLWERACSRMR